MSNLKVEVCLTPLLYVNYRNDNSIVVVIDILRATTAICTAFEYGVKEMIPVASEEEAYEYKRKGFLVGGERNGEQLEGLDFGNSPYHYMGDHIKGKTVVLTTTNGTQAIEQCKDAYKVIIGAFTNLTALCDFLKNEGKDVILLCSGWKNKFNLEDSLFAGAVVDELANDERFTEFADSSLAARYLFQVAKDDAYKFLRNSSHRKRLAKLNLKEDIKYSLSFDKSSIIPILKDGKLVAL
jgi:2-phosphosulfolactate phosphatase